MGKTRRIRTLLYDDQKIDATELDLLHTPALQRLYDLHQLGLADRVFIDASHSRLHHVVGVLQQVENLVAAITKNLEAHPERVLAYYCKDGNKSRTAREMAAYVQQRHAAVRLMGLLHDLTHSPFGHTLEDEIQLIKTKHDWPERQASAFYRLLCQYISWLTRDSGPDDSVQGTWGSTSRYVAMDDEPKTLVARYLDAPDLLPPPEDDDSIRLLASLAAKQLKEDTPARHMSREPGKKELCRFFHDLYFAMRGLLYLDCIHKDNPKHDQIPNPDVGAYSFAKLIKAILERAESPLTDADIFCPHHDAFLLDVIGNTICADLLDYAKRDSHFAGLKLDYDPDRIVENFTLVSHNETQGPFPAPLVRTAISMFSHKLRLDVPGELLNLLQVRFYLSQRVLFHPTKCIAGAMLGAALQLIGWRELPDHLAYVGDAVFLHQVSEAARIVRDLLKKHSSSANANPTLTQEFSTSLIAYLEAIPSTGITLAAKTLLEHRVGQHAHSIQDDLRAAIRLLDRLASRRYHRTIFRVLPDVNLGGTRAADVAGTFQDPTARFRIEREIERAAELPRGTVVIHCPNSDGHKKIAAMLIAMEDRNRAHRLRHIGNLNESLFQKHQDAIQALEEMYKSMWRLEVAVAPPFRPEFKRINKFVEQVLYKQITNRDLGENKLPNDKYMSLELEAATEKENLIPGKDVVRVKDSCGDETIVPARQFQVGQLAAEVLKNHPMIQSFLAEHPGPIDNGDQFDSTPSLEDVGRMLLELLSDRPATVAGKPVTIEESAPTAVELAAFRPWFTSLKGRLPKGETKTQLGKAERRLRAICEPLTPDVERQLRVEIERVLIFEASNTRGNQLKGVDGNEVVRVAEEMLRELQTKTAKKPKAEPKSLFD